MKESQPSWPIFRGNNLPHEVQFPTPPPWRRFEGQLPEDSNAWTPPSMVNTREEKIGSTYISDHKTRELVNAALFLSRPLLITGNPGTGKSSLAYAVAYELTLGQVLHWPITSRSTLAAALYQYDAIGRLHDAQMKHELHQPPPDGHPQASQKAELLYELRNIGKYVRLGPLGTALLPAKKPRVLLIDEIDKSNLDLPNDLLHVFETGEYEIPELTRLRGELNEISVLVHGEEREVLVKKGKVKCNTFPFVVMTSNGERELPPPFLRRCIRLNIEEPKKEDLAKIIARKFKEDPNGPTVKIQLDNAISLGDDYDRLISEFLQKREEQLSTDQLLNAVYLRMQGIDLDDVLNPEDEVKQKLLDAIFRPLRGI
jgi:MoxR-like ATPase